MLDGKFTVRRSGLPEKINSHPQLLEVHEGEQEHGPTSFLSDLFLSKCSINPGTARFIELFKSSYLDTTLITKTCCLLSGEGE